MALPEAKVKTKDGGLGIITPTGDNIIVKMGICSAGVANTLYAFNDLQTLIDTLGTGPLVESLAETLTRAGGPVYGMRITASTPGTNSAVVHTGTGTSVMTVAGVPTDDFDVKVKIIDAAANLAANTASFQYSLDGGDTYSPTTAIPVSGVVPIAGTGLTFTFGAGTFVALDTYTFTSASGSFTPSDVNTTIGVLNGESLVYSLIHVIGVMTGANAAAMAAALQTTMDAAFNTLFTYARAIIEADDTDANLKAAFLTTVGERVLVAAGYCELTSPLTQRLYKRSAAWPFVSRLTSTQPHVHPGEVDLGALVGVTKLYRDEYKTPGLDAARFVTLRTFKGKIGFYVTRGPTMAAPGSDFSNIMNCRVMDKACTIARNKTLNFVNKDLRIDPVSGQIDGRDASSIESAVNQDLSTQINAKGQASGSAVVVNRTTNILSTNEIFVDVQVIPKGYAEFITTTCRFLNPALAAQAA